MKDSIFFSKKLTYLIVAILISAIAKPAKAEVTSAAIDQEASIQQTRIDSFSAEQLRSEESTDDANAIETEPTRNQISCDFSATSPEPNSSICRSSQEQVPRTLEQAGFSNQPIFVVPNLTAQTAAPAPAAPSDPTLDLRVLPRVGANFTTGPGVGYESFYGSVEGFVPLFQQPGENLAFLQGRALLSTEDARLGGNLVLGDRTYSRQSDRRFYW